MEKTNTQKMVMGAMLAALCCVATMVIKIPSPLNGYINLGDCIVLLCGWLLSPHYAFLAAGVGSALADVFSGYVVYAPATFLIKATMALIVCYSYRNLKARFGDMPTKILGAVAAELLMILGYYIFEGFLYGFIPSLVNIPANAVQGVAGIIIALLLSKMLKVGK